ncbi:MAG: acyl--CoA ligase, partial [Clostridia bacterium]|nr:acyl--CoA ligase [Clostridia bacterium]
MTIIDVLEQNAIQYPKETALVEINPQFEQSSRITWRDYALIQPEPGEPFRREITWTDFEQKANRFANLLLTRGCKKGDKIAILLMNSIEWLPIYFGILKAGAVVVPLNYRYTADEIKYCLDKADCSMLVFGPEFIGRVEQICDRLPNIAHMFYVGEDCPSFADSYDGMIRYCSIETPGFVITEEDNAAIYFSSGTTGFPKAILHSHRALMHAARTEQNHHGQTHDDVFLCIPPLYHTGAKMHWFGSFLVGGRADVNEHHVLARDLFLFVITALVNGFTADNTDVTVDRHTVPVKRLLREAADTGKAQIAFGGNIGNDTAHLIHMCRKKHAARGVLL